MTRRLTAAQALDLHAHVHKLLSRSHARAAEMVRRGEHAARDGFPASSMGGAGSSGTAPRPTEQTALAPPMEDRTGEHIAEWERVLKRMAADARLLDGLSAKVMEVEAGERGRQSTLRACANPSCGVAVLGPLRRGRCEACAKYLNRTGMDRPSELAHGEAS